MRRNYAVFIILIIINGLVMADVGNEDLNQICKLTEKGQYKQALEKHLWFHEESKKSPGMAGVRLSYAISAWINLGNV